MMSPPADVKLLNAITDATASAFRRAEIELPPDVKSALKWARERETQDVARAELDNIHTNITEAQERSVPLCQDTGVPVIYLTLPPGIPFCEELSIAVAEGVQRATEEVPLRPNVVNPFTRTNSRDNCGEGMPAIHITTGDSLTITVLPKGAGSENVSRTAMLLPSRQADIERFVVETMLLAGGKPCPPVVLGVGIGSTFDGVAALAKEALLLHVDDMTPFEQQLCDAVNALGIGAMGLGGDVTALAVKVRHADCHTASLPVAVNVQCWACRRATVHVEVL